MLATLLCAGSWAADVSDRVEEANKLLRQGNATDALSIFRDLQAEEPNAPEVVFGLGCAQYQEATKEDSTLKPEDAAKLLNDAMQNFERAEVLAERGLRADSGYNHGNALAQIAKRSANEESDKVKAAYQRSIQAYESFLQRHPGYEPAQHNLDHMRYNLKLMQQQPPPPQPQSGDNDEQQQGDKDQQQQQQQQDQGQDQQDGEKSPQEQPSEGSQDQQQSPDQSSQQNMPNQPEDKNQPGKPQADRQSIEALLDSLENVDKEEQKRLREAGQDRRLTKEWW